MSLFRLIRRFINNPLPEDLSGPAADQLIHQLSFDFHGGKLMYMRVPAETEVPINEVPYVPSQPEPPSLAQLARQPIVLPDIEHGEKHHATLYKDEWRWIGFGRLNDAHGSLFIQVDAGFNTIPEINERDEQQARSLLQQRNNKYRAECNRNLPQIAYDKYLAPYDTLRMREQLHKFRSASAIVIEAANADSDEVGGRSPHWTYYVPISQRMVLTLHIHLRKGQGSWTAPRPPNDSWYRRGQTVVAAILDSVEFVGPWPGFIE